MNVIFVEPLAKDRFTLSIQNDFCDIIMNGIKIMHRQLRNGIYKWSQPVSIVYATNKCPRVDNVTDAYLWHCRLGHINKNRINRR